MGRPRVGGLYDATRGEARMGVKQKTDAVCRVCSVRCGWCRCVPFPSLAGGPYTVRDCAVCSVYRREYRVLLHCTAQSTVQHSAADIPDIGFNGTANVFPVVQFFGVLVRLQRSPAVLRRAVPLTAIAQPLPLAQRHLAAAVLTAEPPSILKWACAPANQPARSPAR